MTLLLKSTEFRAGIYNTADDLTGGVMQVVNYRDSLLKNFHSLNSGELIDAFDPKCVVIIGYAGEELNDKNKPKTFELYRNQLSDVSVITFDELVRKDWIHRITSSANQPTERRLSLTCLGKSPRLIISYIVERDKPVCRSTSGSRHIVN